MLLLLFSAGEQTYAFDTGAVVEVLPRVVLRTIPHAPPPVLGLLSYRGTLVPVIEFNALIDLPPAPDRLSTRIVVTEFAAGEGEVRRLAVVAGRVNHVVRGEVAREVARIDLAEAPYLGALYEAEGGLVQLVNPDLLLPDALADSLYGGRAGAT